MSSLTSPLVVPGDVGERAFEADVELGQLGPAFPRAGVQALLQGRFRRAEQPWK
jgi:hypothetical protein